MQLYRINITTDVYANEDWDSIKDNLVIAYKTEDGDLVAGLPGTFETIKIIDITKDTELTDPK
jgi:hypothetical protein